MGSPPAGALPPPPKSPLKATPHFKGAKPRLLPRGSRGRVPLALTEQEAPRPPGSENSGGFTMPQPSARGKKDKKPLRHTDKIVCSRSPSDLHRLPPNCHRLPFNRPRVPTTPTPHHTPWKGTDGTHPPCCNVQNDGPQVGKVAT